MFHSLAMFLRWKNAVFVTWEIWFSKDSLLSNITPRFLTAEEVTVHPSNALECRETKAFHRKTQSSATFYIYLTKVKILHYCPPLVTVISLKSHLKMVWWSLDTCWLKFSGALNMSCGFVVWCRWRLQKSDPADHVFTGPDLSTHALWLLMPAGAVSLPRDDTPWSQACAAHSGPAETRLESPYS